MNITIVQGAFLPVPPVAGGAVEKLWFDLGKEFARRGFDVTHISRAWPGLSRSEQVAGVAYERITGFDRPRSRLLAMTMDLVYSVRCIVKLKRPDVIVTNTFFLPFLLPIFARHSVVYVSVHRFPQGQMRFYTKVDRLQCVSTVIADAVRAQAPLLKDLVKVVPNYISSRLSRKDVEATWDARRREVLFVGRVHPEKGVDLLIQAFARIDPEVRSGWTLRIVGPHETPAGGGGKAFLHSLKQSATALNVPVEWEGPIYDPQALNTAYRRARIFVYPSTAAKGEAFPLAPLEAMAQGCPVITSDLSCFSDFIEPGVNANSFALSGSDVSGELAKVMAVLMRNESDQRAYGIAALHTVEQFTLTRVADTFIDDFASLCAA